MDYVELSSPLPRVGHPTLDGLSEQFLRLVDTFPEAPAPVHARWTSILQHFPKMRTRPLYEDLSDIVAEGENATGTKLIAAYDLVLLQVRFFALLRANKFVLPHTFEWCMTRNWVWQERLNERLRSTRAYRRNKFGKVKAEHKPQVKALWLN